MSLRDPKRAGQSFGVEEPVRRALAAWGRERDSEIGRLNLARAAAKMTEDQRMQLIERLAEVSLGLLFTLLEGGASATPADGSPAGGG